MSLNTYANLQTALQNALHRSDLSSAVADFITLCEDRLNKRLRLRAMETRVTASISSEYISLPTGFLSMRNFQLNTSPRTRLEYATPEWLDAKFAASSNTGTPAFYTLVGGEIQLAPIPDGTYTAEMDYYKKFDLATDLTNWLLTNAPRAYYYGSLLEAAVYLKNDARVPVWQSLWETALAEIEKADELDGLPISGLAMRPVGTIV